MTTTPTRERNVEEYFVSRAEAAGCEVRKLRWIGRRNATDRVLMGANHRYSDITNTVWVELKKPGEKPTTSQHREHGKMRAVGQIVIVIDSFASVDALFP